MEAQIGKSSPVRLSAAVLSDTGLVRAENQDCVLSLPEPGLFAVADGMGGGEGGALAARWVCESLEGAARAMAADTSVHGLLEALRIAIGDANARIADFSRARGYRAMGSTVALVAAEGPGRDRALVCWVGDSRVYRFRDGSAECLTRDHTVGRELGDASPMAEALSRRSHPLAHVLTRAVGTEADLDIEGRRVDLRPGDRFLVCSDGIHDVMEDEDLRAMFACSARAGAPAPDGAGDLARLAAEVRRRGAPDNFSAVLVDATGKEPA